MAVSSGRRIAADKITDKTPDNAIEVPNMQKKSSVFVCTELKRRCAEQKKDKNKKTKQDFMYVTRIMNTADDFNAKLWDNNVGMLHVDHFLVVVGIYAAASMVSR